ncbi:threonine aldolase family protein [Parasphaerochaeta coccoides]|uniref:Threonine aldolase n=1 Tax=Parasphaerochaeta coccoides (strain ATCC BAA-1237 / DSM 17374 / SPN1) TaxID=760011 RepID=F4GI38_PARC1|nr:GntG family PLP-dependent aldolase [Parasphaerochaeta coccoides]AEC02636.1 Threonine aldolase [Parasphaerochaeta coccoides DSM 17374]
MKIYDLRSDTVTLPDPNMRKAMYEAEVGDDVYHEDPSVNRLQDMAAEITGTEAALFVTSGSMGNLIPLYVNAGRGTEVLAASQSHIIQHEVGAISAIAGTMPIGISVPRGILTVDAIKDAVKPLSYDLARTAMLEIENTIGGYPYDLENVTALAAFAHKKNMTVHMDGARIFNAATATGMSVSAYVHGVDTMTFCLSKGLGAPVGSLLCGSLPFIEAAMRVRKILGGGMRQSGILAAAGIYALEHNVKRLSQDHEHATVLAQTLHASGWANVDMEGVKTNIIFFTVPGMSEEDAVSWLAEAGIRVGIDGGKIRLVTNLNITDDDVQDIIVKLERMAPPCKQTSGEKR